MTTESLLNTVRDLATRLDGPIIPDADILRWASPIPVFGDLVRSRVATVGLNPSIFEFVDRNGHELDGKARRFHTLSSLNLRRWSEAEDCHFLKLLETYLKYFQRNPYDSWFRQLDFIIRDTGTSYYGANAGACHLDLVPYATNSKWSNLTSQQRAVLVRLSSGFLLDLINASQLRVLILNGRSVVELFAELFGTTFVASAKAGWDLRRQGRSRVSGYSYFAKLAKLLGRPLVKPIVLIGFNHNLQSSFGISLAIRSRIRDWITQCVREHLE